MPVTASTWPEPPINALGRLLSGLARRARTERDFRSSRGSGADVAVFHEFHAPPYGGGNQFLLALVGELQRRGLIFVDLVPDFRALPAAGVDRLYLPGAPGGRHFSAEGHRFVALRLHERLRAIPEAARRIEG